MDNEIEEFMKQHEICYDRFTFDKVFRFLIKNDFKHEDAKALILFNCSLSALVLQERIHNRYYKKIKAEDEISNDLLQLMNDAIRDHLEKTIANLLNEKK